MLTQVVENFVVYQITSGVLVLLTILLGFFAAIPLVRYLERQNKVALYYGFSNLAFLVTSTISNIGITDVLETGEKTMLYYASLLGMNVGIIMASLFLYQFYAKLSGVDKKARVVSIAGAAGIIAFQLLPFNGWFTPDAGGFQLKYISYLLQTIYCCVIYVILARGFLRLSKRVDEDRKYFRAISAGNVLLSLFFVMMLSRAFTGDSPILPIIQIGSWGLMTLAISLLFYGFVIPTFKQAQQSRGQPEPRPRPQQPQMSGGSA